ncbi:hypothetical protein ACIBPB_27530 [Micromonospora sp. NPDC049836]|uniref:hypothetical protein n=1 Tax=Micromonospora sp. NPDC049836 TaxID=3364274 RepID=UPI0037A6A0A3
MGEYNPDRPYVLGNQWAPLVADQVQLDTGSEVGYTFRARATHTPGNGLRRVRIQLSSPPPGLTDRKELLANVYPVDRVAGTGPLRKIVIPCASGALVTGATLVGGASTPGDAVSNPADPRYVALTGPNAAARFWFGKPLPPGISRLRILDVSVLYVISGPFADLAPAVTLGLERPSAAVNWIMDETLNGPAEHSAGTAVGRSRLGELNPWWDTAAAPTTQRGRAPWRWQTGNGVAGLNTLSASGGTNVNVRLQVSAAAAAAAQFRVHYLALEVTYGVENRLGGGGLDISQGPTGVIATGSTSVTGWYFEIPVQGIDTADVQLVAGREYAVTIGQAYAGQKSVATPVPVKLDRLGPVDPFPAHRGVLLRKTLRAAQAPTVETVEELPAIQLMAGDPAPGTVDMSGHTYMKQVAGSVSRATTGWDTFQHVVETDMGDWVWARFYARHVEGARDALELALVGAEDMNRRLGPVGRITVEEFDKLPEIADGWREVTVRLDPPYLSDGVGDISWWAFTSKADPQAPWQVLGADADPAIETYGSTGSNNLGPAAASTYGDDQLVHAAYDGQRDQAADLTLMFAQEMDGVLGLDVQPAVQPLTVVDEQCARPAVKIPTGIRYHRLSWLPVNTAVVGGWAYYEVQRQDDTMGADEWETIAKVVEPSVTAVDDYEARVGVESRYRIRMVHRLGIGGPWSPPVAATIAAPGVEGRNVDTGVLILTSNHNPAGNLAYVENFDRSSVEEFQFPEAGQVELQEMFDRDYRTAFRPLERGGVEFTRTVLVNQAAVPPETMDRGFQDLRDLAWDTVPYVCVRDELNNRWLSTLLVPSASVKRRKAGQLQLAQVQVVEVTATPAPLDGGPAPCEGLRPEGQVSSVTASAPVPVAGLATLVFEDLFGRNVAGGLGNGWAITEGPAADFSVAAEAAAINLAGGASHTAVVGAGWEDVDVEARFQFNAVATGQPINAYLIGRQVNGNTHYRARLAAQTDGKLGVAIERIVGGVLTTVTALATVKDRFGTALAYQAGPWYWMRLQVRDAAVRVAVWADGQDMARWEQSAKDTGIAGVGQVGVRGVLTAGNTNAAPTVKVASFSVQQPVSNDLDLRVELRPTGEAWTAELRRTDDTAATGWKLTADRASTCLNVWGGAGFTGCYETRQLVVTRQRRWLRVTYRNDVGGQGAVQFWASEDGVAWQAFGTVSASPEAPTFDPGQLAVVLTGDVTVARAEVRQGVDGPLLAAPAFEVQAAGTTQFADAQGNVWEVDGRGICAPA